MQSHSFHTLGCSFSDTRHGAQAAFSALDKDPSKFLPLTRVGAVFSLTPHKAHPRCGSSTFMSHMKPFSARAKMFKREEGRILGKKINGNRDGD